MICARRQIEHSPTRTAMIKKANTTISLSHLRKEYTLAGLTESDLEASPIEQFKKWFMQSVDAKLLEPTAMTLATATKAGKPSARIVLLKKFDEQGFVFFSNYNSRKGRDLSENPFAALVFHWIGLERQVRIIGSVSKVSRAESGNIFARARWEVSVLHGHRSRARSSRAEKPSKNESTN